MTAPNPVGACPHYGQRILALPTTDGTEHFDEVAHHTVPADQRHVWLGSVGVVALPRHWPQPGTVLRPHTCLGHDDPSPADVADSQSSEGLGRRDAANSVSDSGDDNQSDSVERRRYAWARANLRAQLVELNRLKTQMILYRAQHNGTVRPHPGQRTYEPVTITTALADVGRVSPTRCPLCGRQLAHVTGTLGVGVVGQYGQPLYCCAPTCTAQRSSDASNRVDAD